MARPRAHSGADGPKEPHSVSLKGESCFSSHLRQHTDCAQFYGECGIEDKQFDHAYGHQAIATFFIISIPTVSRGHENITKGVSCISHQ